MEVHDTHTHMLSETPVMTDLLLFQWSFVKTTVRKDIDLIGSQNELILANGVSGLCQCTASYTSKWRSKKLRHIYAAEDVMTYSETTAQT